jgi:hypothetical protein
MGIELVAYAKGLFEDTLLLIVDTSVLSPIPLRGWNCMPELLGQNFLQDDPALQLDMLGSDLELAISADPRISVTGFERL